jgi:putative Mg2+ transporter-C (MgtC) family protein
MTDLWEIAVKIGLSALLAGAIGAEREWVGKWAGLRTHMLIAVGAALLTHVSVLIGALYAGGSNAWDPGRISAQIVSGVGFLGAGTIIQARGAVHGLTTAAGLWVASALGIAVGAGFYSEAAITTIALLLILVALRPVERRLLHGDRQMVLFELREGRRPSDLLALLEGGKVEVEEVTLDPRADPPAVAVRLRGSTGEVERLVARAAEDGITTYERKSDRTAPPH